MRNIWEALAATERARMAEEHARWELAMITRFAGVDHVACSPEQEGNES